MPRTLVRILPAVIAAAVLTAVPGALPFASSSADDVYGPFPPPAVAFARTGAQPGPVPLSESERISREIVSTDRALADAEGRVRRSGNDKARSDYRNARDRQWEAKEARAQSLFARSARLTLEARAYVKSALIQAGPRENDPEVVGRALDQTDDALQRAKDILEDGAAARHRRLFVTLRDRQEDARRLYKNGAVRGAYAETRDVRRGVLALLRKCADLPVSREIARKAVRRAEQALAQTRKEMGPRPVSQAVRLERAAALQMARARSSYVRSQYRDALIHAKLVERNLQRAVEARRVATSQSG